MAFRAVSPEWLEIPEHAIAAFEGATRLGVVVHDLGLNIWPFLRPDRFQHCSDVCRAVKARHDWACVQFEVEALRREIGAFPEGRCHVCHAGFTEWVVPITREGRLAALLFAGQRRAPAPWAGLVRDTRSTRPLVGAGLPAVAEKEAMTILELLRQLRARLVTWRAEASALLSQAGNSIGPIESPLASRRLDIQRFLHQSHGSHAPIGLLARRLGLSSGRTMHLVRELFGQSYGQLLSEMRLRTAAALLRQSGLAVAEVGLASGFRDISHFHRVFRKRFGTSPLQYRRQNHA